MLTFFRRIINSKVGFVVTFLVLGVIALAFAAGDVSNLAGGATGGIASNQIAKVGSEDVTIADLRQRATDEVAAARRQNPAADMAGYIQAGAFDASLQRMVTNAALAAFGRDQGMVASRRLVDGQIASIPGLQGPTGKFDENLYRRILAERRLTDAGIRRDIAQELIAQQLLAPTASATLIGAEMARPYVGLLLEERRGAVAQIPASAMPAGATPTDAEVQSFYTRNAGRYRVPERRTVRYALATPDSVAARAQPTEAEVAQAYQQNRARYQAAEKRTVAQVIVADRAGADALAARVRGGTALAEAARGAGLEAATFTALDKAALAQQSSAPLAEAAFAAARGAVVGPVRTPLGFAVARVENVEQTAARSLDQVRGELTAEIRQRKTAEALAALNEKLDTALADGATFEEAVADTGLTARATPSVAASGVDPLAPAAPDPAIQPLVAAAFGAAEGDGPQLVQTGNDGSFAVVAVGQVVPAAPRPLADIRQRVVDDLIADRRRQAARRVAGEVLAAVNRGTPLAQAVRAAGAGLPAPREIGGNRGELSRQPDAQSNPASTLLFSMTPGKAKLAPLPDGSGWVIVRLESARQIDPGTNPSMAAGIRGELGRLSGQEFAQQFANAARGAVGVRIDPAAVSALKAELSGQGGSDN